MIKSRIIGVVLIKTGIVVQSIQFEHFLPIGSPEVAISYLDRWGIDEIIVLHGDATINAVSPTIAEVSSYAKHCQVPLSIGGGLKDLNQIKACIHAGADKVILNSCLIEDPQLIKKTAELFGRQSVIVSLDVKSKSRGNFEVFTHSGTKATGRTVQELAIEAMNLGAGELMITSIDRDGTKKGYDINLIQSVQKVVNIPLIICGGVGNPCHIQEALSYGVSGLAVGNFFHFIEHSVIITKQFLKQKADPVRIDSHVTYDNLMVRQGGRISRHSDEILEKLRFKHVKEEII